MASRTLIALVLLASLVGACRVIDVRTDPELTGLHSDALIEGYATFGFADDPSFLRLDVLDGPSPGSVLYLEVWYLLRFELGLAGLAVGVGPFDIGIGTLFYHPRSPLAHTLPGNLWRLHGPRAAQRVEDEDDDSRDHEASAADDPSDTDADADAPQTDTGAGMSAAESKTAALERLDEQVGQDDSKP